MAHSIASSVPPQWPGFNLPILEPPSHPGAPANDLARVARNTCVVEGQGGDGSESESILVKTTFKFLSWQLVEISCYYLAIVSFRNLQFPKV
jgi:hypothetical protein